MPEITHKMEYVASAAAHSRITISSANHPDATRRIKQVFDKATAMSKNHSYTTLYNAFTERPLGKTMYECDYLPAPMHSDSGGLQMVTRGMSVDEEAKKKVYVAQAEFSKWAMCFDEIPVDLVGVSKIGDINNRVFRTDLVEEKAKATCKNILSQARTFINMGVDTKIFLIVQGNCYDTYMRWIDECVRFLPKEIYPFLAGMSFAGSSSGSGELEDIERLYSFASCDAPDEWKKNLHLLGVGSIRRMFPLIGFLHSGLIHDIKVSYDSTTHTGGMSYRRMNDINGNVIEYGGGDRVRTRQLYDYAKQYFDIEASFEMFYEAMQHNRDNFEAKFGKDSLPLFHEIMIAACMVSIVHTTNILDDVASSKKKFKLDAATKYGVNEMQFLSEIKTREDYDSFMRTFTPHLKSSRIKKSDEIPASLEEWF